MKTRLALLACLPPLLLSGCIAAALAAERETTVNWHEKCEKSCAEPYMVQMYHEDGRVEVVSVSVYRISPPIGCFCPKPTNDKDKTEKKK